MLCTKYTRVDEKNMVKMPRCIAWLFCPPYCKQPWTRLSSYFSQARRQLLPSQNKRRHEMSNMPRSGSLGGKLLCGVQGSVSWGELGWNRHSGHGRGWGSRTRPHRGEAFGRWMRSSPGSSQWSGSPGSGGRACDTAWVTVGVTPRRSYRGGFLSHSFSCFVSCGLISVILLLWIAVFVFPLSYIFT